MGLSVVELSRYPRPDAGWPDWVVTVRYEGAAHPQAASIGDIEHGANCQRYAYAVLGLFGRVIPPHRSSELWDDASFEHITQEDAQDLDLVLFNSTAESWGAHVAVVLGDRLLHLCAEENRPALWAWNDFAQRDRYSHIIGIVRTHSD